MKSSLSLHSIIKQSKYRAISCHQVFKQTSPLRSPRTWWDDLSHWNCPHCTTEKSEAAPESSRFFIYLKENLSPSGWQFFHFKWSYPFPSPLLNIIESSSWVSIAPSAGSTLKYCARSYGTLNYRLRNWVRNQKNAVYYCRLFSLSI